MVDHPILVRSLGVLRSGTAPLIVERTDQDFLAAVLKQLGESAGGLVFDLMPKQGRPDKPFKLYQPIHRTFYIALAEVICDTPLQVRLDPNKIDSAGLVIRRIDPASGATQAWMRRAKTIRGWVPVQPGDEKRDPDPARRPRRLSSGNAGIDAQLDQLTGQASPDEETVSPLFVAPPEVCAALKRTVLYGLVPVVSSEMSETDPAVPPYDDSDLADHLPVYLHSGSAYDSASWSGNTYTFADVTADQLTAAIAADVNQIDLLQFVTMLRQLTLELDAFSDSAASTALHQALNSISLAFPEYLTFSFDTFAPQSTEDVVIGYSFVPAGDFLKQASEVLVQGTGASATPPASIRMPIGWPAISSDQQTAFIDAIRVILKQQAVRAAKSETRFQNPSRTYTARAFVRVRRSDGCPPAIQWSDPTDPFQIAPWYEDNGLPPAQIALPDLSALKNLKPTVSFSVPKPLFDFLQANSMKALTEGKGHAGGGGIQLDWICSFSLPSITLCAFIVLNIFLGLFDLIFHWLAFIKICIPIPKPR